jgi:hypothetical protein
MKRSMEVSRRSAVVEHDGAMVACEMNVVNECRKREKLMSVVGMKTRTVSEGMGEERHWGRDAVYRSRKQGSFEMGKGRGMRNPNTLDAWFCKSSEAKINVIRLYAQ